MYSLVLTIPNFYQKIKAHNTGTLKRKLEFDPCSFLKVYPNAEKWGVDTELLREDQNENTHNVELQGFWYIETS